jgi:membrane protease YdiL (CAAX protease family)
MMDGAEFASLGNEKSVTGGRGKPAGAGRSRGRDLAEWVLAYGLILMVIWTPRPLQRVLWMVAVVALALMIVLSVKVDRLGLDEPGRGWLDAMGLRRKNLGRSLWVAGVALAIAGAAIGVAARMGTLHTLHGFWDLVRSYWGYALWSFVQQFLMLGFFLTRLRRLLRSARVAAVATALIFALAHLPNPILTPLTLVWGVCACMLFLHYRNLYPLAMAHAVLGITVAIAIPGPVVHNMRVGLGYLTYGRHAAPARTRPLLQP